MRTKDGRRITLNRIEDAEGDGNRGWRIDLLEASVDGKAAGYLKLGYIPKARFDAHYQAGILSYLDLIKGHALFPSKRVGEVRQGPEDHNIAGIDDASLRKFVSGASWRLLYKDLSTAGELDAMGRPELLSMVKAIEKAVTVTRGKCFKEFKSFFIDKPHVEFIRVNEELRRQGIARTMYVEGAKWMASKGMRLYASSLQQPEAARAWDSMAHWSSVDGKRRYLDIAKIVIDQAACPSKTPRLSTA